MRREEVDEVVGRLPPNDVAKLVFVVRAGFALNVETLYRLEPQYVVFRGRESGTNDEGRAFFLPYDEIVYLRVERVVTLAELKLMYGETPTDADRHDGPSLKETAAAPATPAATPATPAPSAPLDPAAIAKQNLLERIRAARTSAGGAKSGKA